MKDEVTDGALVLSRCRQLREPIWSGIERWEVDRVVGLVEMLGEERLVILSYWLLFIVLVLFICILLDIKEWRKRTLSSVIHPLV